MAETVFPLEATEYTAADAQLWFATRTSGVYANNHLGVSTSGNMNVTLKPGIAWLHYDDFAGCVYGNRDELSLTLEMSDASYDRIDRVCIRLERLQNRGYAYIKKGTAAKSPVPPALQRDNVAYEISVARIRVGVGVTAINAGNITDERFNKNVCGLMSDGVTGIDTSVIQAQFESLINRLETELQAVYAGVEKVNLIERTATLLASGWSADAPYTQTVAAADLLGADSPEVDVDLTTAITADEMTELNEAWGNVLKATAGAGSLTVVFSDVPEVNIPIKIKVVR